MEAKFSPDIMLLSALESELLGFPPGEKDAFGVWAREVAAHLGQICPARGTDSQAVMAVATRALRDIMCSGSWRFLLEDALNRPLVFARTLAIMMNGRVEPGQAPLMQ